MKRLFPIACLLMCATTLMAQEFPSISWMDAHLERVFRIGQDSTWEVWNRNDWERKRKLLFEQVNHIDFRGVDKLIYVPGSNRPAFVAEGTGQVYELDSIRGVFRRLDKTTDRGMNYGAIYLHRKDMLYAIGGHGFGHSHAMVALFNRARGQWLIEPVSGGPVSVDESVWQYDAGEDVLYVAYSRQITAAQGDLRSNRVWRYSFDTRTWEQRGNLTEAAFDLVESDPSGVQLPIGWYSGDEHKLVNLAENRIDQIDPLKSDIRIQEVSPADFTGSGTFIGAEALVNMRAERVGGSVETVSRRHTWSELRSARQTPQLVWAQPESNSWLWIILSVGTTALLVLVYRLRDQFAKPFRKGVTTTVEEAFFNSLDRREVTLLRALMRSGMRGEGMKSERITHIMGWGEKSWDNQRKWRNNLIRELNQRAEKHLHIKELITREQALEDKRERVYRLTGEGFRLLRDSIHFISDQTTRA